MELEVNISKITSASAITICGDQSDSSAYVGWNRDGYLPAFKDADGVAIPFKPTSIRPPVGYRGEFLY
jgi:hypothetical protein